MDLLDKITSATTKSSRFVAALFLSIGLACLHAWANRKLWGYEPFFTEVTLCLLTILVTQMLELQLQLSRKSRSPEAKIKRKIFELNGVLHHLLRNLHKELSTALTPQNNGFECPNRDIAIHSYSKFWSLLLEQQIGRKHKLRVEAIHCHEMDIWNKNGSSPDNLLGLQRDFILAGGEITRILCANLREKNTREKVEEAAAKMLSKKIKVFYCDTKENEHLHSFEWDFLRVEPSHEAAIWVSSKEQIKKASYTNSGFYEETNLEGLWRQLREASTEIVPDPSTGKVVLPEPKDY